MRQRLAVPCLISVALLLSCVAPTHAAPSAEPERAAKIRALLQELKPPRDAGAASGEAEDLSLPDDRKSRVASRKEASPAKGKVVSGPAAPPPASVYRDDPDDSGLAPLPGGAFTPDRDGKIPFDAERIRAALFAPVVRYRIGPGDLLDLNVYDSPEFTKEYRVGPDGGIMIPIYGRIEVGGRTAEEVSADVARRLQAIFVDPKVVASVKEFANNHVILLGRVGFPGRYEFKGRPNLLELFALGKGVEPIQQVTTGGGTAGVSSRFGRCMIFRGAEQIIEVDLDRLFLDGMADLNLPLEPGDVVNVPRSAGTRVFVLGQVVHPGFFAHEQGMTLMQALSLAGSSRDQADLKRVRVVRPEADGRRRVIVCDVSGIVRGKRIRDIELSADDVVFVPRKGSEKFLYTVGWINTALSTIVLGDHVASLMQKWD